jgi:hypothetical protein
MATVSVVVEGYRPRLASFMAIIRRAKAATAWRSRTPARDCLETALLERLAEHVEDVPPARRAFGPAAHARVRPRPLARHRDLTAADQPTSEIG